MGGEPIFVVVASDLLILFHSDVNFVVDWTLKTTPLTAATLTTITATTTASNSLQTRI